MSTQEARASAPRAKKGRKPKKHPSRIRVYEFNVLIKQKMVDETFEGSSLIRPVETQEKEQAAMTEGEIIAVSPFAFDYAEWGSKPKPKVGEVCIFAKYTGQKCRGRDGEEYLMIKDKDIAGVYDD
jgi:co-chaperonin GroES (HSP10)